MKKNKEEKNKMQIFLKNIKENKYSLILLLIGYLFFVLDNNLLKNMTNLFILFKGWVIILIYFLMMIISYFEVKIFIRIYKKYTIKMLKGFFDKFYFIFVFISIGSLLGFTISIFQALIIVIFERYINIF